MIELRQYQKDYLNKLTKNLIKEYDGNIGVNIYTDLLGKNIKKIEVSSLIKDNG